MSEPEIRAGAEVKAAGKTRSADLCWLCGRLLGGCVERHHPVPKSRGGREIVSVHPICHRAIHAHFTNADLARLPPEPLALREREEMARFLDWIADKPADFHAPTFRPGGSARNGRRR